MSESSYSSESEEEPPKSADAEPSSQIKEEMAANYTISKEDAHKVVRLSMEVPVPSRLRVSTFTWQNSLQSARCQAREWLRDNTGELHLITTSHIAAPIVLLYGLWASELPMHLEAPEHILEGETLL